MRQNSTYSSTVCAMFDVASYLSWSAYESECSDLGASMLCIPDYYSHTWISEQLSYNYYYYACIGYSDLPNKDGAYHWSSGCSSTLTNFGYSSYNSDCFYLVYDAGGVWNSQKDEADSSITCSCEYSVVPSTAPTEVPSSPTYAPSISCTTGWTLYNNNCYQFNVANTVKKLIRP